MCLEFMQSEHMKKLLFTINPLFFFLSTQDAGDQRAAAGEVVVGGEEELREHVGGWPHLDVAHAWPAIAGFDMATGATR